MTSSFSLGVSVFSFLIMMVIATICGTLDTYCFNSFSHISSIPKLQPSASYYPHFLKECWHTSTGSVTFQGHMSAWATMNLAFVLNLAPELLLKFYHGTNQDSSLYAYVLIVLVDFSRNCGNELFYKKGYGKFCKSGPRTDVSSGNVQERWDAFRVVWPML